MEDPSASAAEEACTAWNVLPDELWALVLSKFTWGSAWRQAKVLLCWRPGVGKALQSRPDLLAQLLTGDAKRGSSGAFSRARSCNRADVAALLLAQTDGSINCCQELVIASAIGQLEVVKLLLGTPLQGEEWTHASKCALDQTAIHGHTAVAAALLARGVDEDVRGVDDFEYWKLRALRWALWFGHIQVVKMMMAAGVRLSAEPYDLETAARRGYEDVVRLLLQHGAAMGPNGEAALLRQVVANGHMGTAQLLVARGRPFTRAAARRLQALLQPAE